MSDEPSGDPAERIDRLLDAIELVKQNQPREAETILRELIGKYNDFEAAWLWMSVVVDSVDKSIICLDNVLRINPNNLAASTALYQLRFKEIASEKRRSRLRLIRGVAFGVLWLLSFVLMLLAFVSSIEQLAAVPLSG